MLQDVFRKFPAEGEATDFILLKGGHINSSYLVLTDKGEKYVLQRINRVVFPNVEAIMDNLQQLREHLHRQNDALPMIDYIDTRRGEAFYEDGEGGAWRLYRYVDDSYTLEQADSGETLFECALAFGRFQYALRDFPAERLAETIPRFHDTPDRYRRLYDAAGKDPCGRLAQVSREMSFVSAREKRAGRLHACRQRGELPLRVTHNDTKLSNVLLDGRTGKARCVIDLDTVMPGLAAYDFGDLVRSGASVAAEDDPDNRIDLGRCEAISRGFLRACPHFSARERELLPLGAYTITLECGVRFLTDYLNGDLYFRIHDPEQNLRRARSMFALVADMEEKWEKIEKISKELT